MADKPDSPKRGLLQDTSRWLTANLKGPRLYISTLALFLASFFQLADLINGRLNTSYQWPGYAIIGGPFLLTLVFHGIPELLKWLRGVKGTGDIENPDYFRIRPYKEGDSDYKRADKMHETVLTWISESRESVLFLSGLSGVGKSSLINAYVLPQLRSRDPKTITLIIRRYNDPIKALQMKLIAPDFIWKKEPKEKANILQLLKAACKRIDGRLLVICDQFEEFMIEHDERSERAKAFASLIHDLKRESIDNLTLLFVLRAESAGLLEGFNLIRTTNNFKEVTAFRPLHAREFLQRSKLDFGPSMIDKIIKELTALEEISGLIKPITLNMVGWVIARSDISAQDRRILAIDSFLEEYLRRCISRYDVKYDAPVILREMITRLGTKKTKTVTELAQQTNLPERSISACLFFLSEQGIVRLIDTSSSLWQISHDFIAQLLRGILLKSPRQTIRSWIAPVSLPVTLVFVILLAIPWNPANRGSNGVANDDPRADISPVIIGEPGGKRVLEFLSDPANREFLGNAKAKSNYQEQMTSTYDRFAELDDSAFTFIDAFDELTDGQQPQESSINWAAFPRLAQGTNIQIDKDRFRLQEEFVEWHAELQGGTGTITFITEFPEYFQAFAHVGMSALVDAIQDVIPGANPTAEELFGNIGVNPDSLSGRRRSIEFRRNLANNPWNNGTKGILCLTQPFNTATALFDVLGECGVLQNQGSEQDTCELVGAACGVGRSSDPQVCKEAQAAVRAGFGITLADPAGIRIAGMTGVWKIDGREILINASILNKGVWTVSRNGRRAVLNVKGGLTLNDDPIVSGAQVARFLLVGADLLAAPEDTLPSWAKTGNEGTRQ